MEIQVNEDDSFSDFCLRILSPLSKADKFFVSEEELPKITCKCKKTKCIKFYCECLAAGSYCSNCDCKGCLNKPNRKSRKRAIRRILQKNPDYFDGQISCSCRKSECTKKYCECLHQGRPCTNLCKCSGCKNHTN